MAMHADRQSGGRPTALTSWSLRGAALAGALLLAACSGGGGGPAATTGTGTPSDPGGTTPAAGPQVSELYFDYTLERDGEAPIAETGSVPLSCPAADCAASDLRLLSGSAGARTREGFGTASAATGGLAGRETLSGASATVSDAKFTRYGFWGEHGHAAVEIGTGTLSASADGQQWRGTFKAAYAWAAGEASGTNPAGTGSATWRGIAEAARTAGFERLMGRAELRIADLTRPRVDADLDLDDGAALEWRDMQLANGGFYKGTAGADRIEGRFHGSGHEEAWGTFDTGAYVGAFGAKRE